MAYEYAYDDRTTGYDAHESFGRHGDDDDDAYDHGGGHAVSHSHSYGRPQHDYPPQPYPRHRASQQPAYEYAHGEYDYPTGVAAEASTPDEYAPPSREHASYDPDRIASDDGAYGAGGYGGRSDRGSSTPGAYGAGRTTVGDIWAADEKHGRVRDERPMLLGSIFCFFALAVVGVVCGIMLAVVFVRPPNVGIAGYTTPRVFVQGQALMMNTTVYAGVSNPNSVGAKLKSVKATIHERDVANHVLGTSEAEGLHIDSHANTTLHLPVQFQIASAQDLNANSETISKISQSCGWDLNSLTNALGSKLSSDLNGLTRRSMPDAPKYALAKRAKSGKIPLNVDLDIKVSVLSLNFNTPVKNVSINVACPSWGDILGGGSGSSSASSSSSPVASQTPSSSRSASASATPTTSAAPTSSSSSTTPGPATSSAAPAPTSVPASTSPENGMQSFVDSVTSNNPGAASVVSQGEGIGQAFSGIISYLQAGSLPIRRAVPTDAPLVA